jgi:formylglycine-generating enzyme required for sulfatase activity
MSWIPGGEFQMGSGRFYPEERPVHRVTVTGFWMDTHPVTVEAFRRFAKATGHVTVAERQPERADYPDADPELLVPGSLVFRRTRGPGRSPRLSQLVGLRPRRLLAAPGPEACWRDLSRPRRRRRRHHMSRPRGVLARPQPSPPPHP